jgi:hypothetical protein
LEPIPPTMVSPATLAAIFSKNDLLDDLFMVCIIVDFY